MLEPGDCDAANAVCVADCAEDAECEAACAANLAQCQDDCVNCIPNCEAAGTQCVIDAREARSATRSLCSEWRDDCNAVCTDPIDRNCVKGCTSDEHGCRNAAKRSEVQCKKQCKGNDGVRACIRNCRKQSNLVQELCEDLAVLCYAGCAGVDPPTLAASPVGT